VDEVCNHAAVLSRGHLIFSGSLIELKGRIRKSHFEMDLDGDQKSITKVVAAIKSSSAFKSVTLKQRRLELRLNEEAFASAALATVCMTLADNKVNVLAIRTMGQQTEQAFLDLVEKEESRGFTRLYTPGEAA
jgi:ABC-2 type transport system ATP-binding protein